MQYNGAAVIAMAGKDCIAIASDKRYGIRNQTMGCQMKKIFQMGEKTFVGLTGLATDMQTLEQKYVSFPSNLARPGRPVCFGLQDGKLPLLRLRLYPSSWRLL